MLFLTEVLKLEHFAPVGCVVAQWHLNVLIQHLQYMQLIRCDYVIVIAVAGSSRIGQHITVGQLLAIMHTLRNQQWLISFERCLRIR